MEQSASNILTKRYTPLEMSKILNRVRHLKPSDHDAISKLSHDEKIAFDSHQSVNQQVEDSRRRQHAELAEKYKKQMECDEIITIPIEAVEALAKAASDANDAGWNW